MKIKIKDWLKSLFILILISTLFLSACGTSNASIATNHTTIAQKDNNTMNNSLPRLEGKAKVELIVNGSPIIIEVEGDKAPITAGNFVDLVDQGVYDGLVFHRVVKDPQPFVVQGGDPQGKNPNVSVSSLGAGSFIDPKTSKPRYVPLEIEPENAKEPVYSKTLQQAGISEPPVLKHTRGAVAMARSQMPDSGSSQFYFALADLAFLDGNYAVFGYVIQGMNVVDKIKMGDRIQSAKVIEGIENLKR